MYIYQKYGDSVLGNGYWIVSGPEGEKAIHIINTRERVCYIVFDCEYHDREKTAKEETFKLTQESSMIMANFRENLD